MILLVNLFIALASASIEETPFYLRIPFEFDLVRNYDCVIRRLSVACDELERLFREQIGTAEISSEAISRSRSLMLINSYTPSDSPPTVYLSAFCTLPPETNAVRVAPLLERMRSNPEAAHLSGFWTAYTSTGLTKSDLERFMKYSTIVDFCRDLFIDDCDVARFAEKTYRSEESLLEHLWTTYARISPEWNSLYKAAADIPVDFGWLRSNTCLSRHATAQAECRNLLKLFITTMFVPGIVQLPKTWKQHDHGILHVFSIVMNERIGDALISSDGQTTNPAPTLNEHIKSLRNQMHLDLRLQADLEETTRMWFPDDSFKPVAITWSDEQSALLTPFQTAAFTNVFAAARIFPLVATETGFWRRVFTGRINDMRRLFTAMLKDTGVILSFNKARRNIMADTSGLVSRLLRGDGVLQALETAEGLDIPEDLKTTRTRGLVRLQQFAAEPEPVSIRLLQETFSGRDYETLADAWHHSDLRMREFMIHSLTRAFQARHWYLRQASATGTMAGTTVIPGSFSEERAGKRVKLEDVDSVEADSSKCAICLDKIERAALTPCKHRFHPHCIIQVLRTVAKTTCPMCRAVLPPPHEPLAAFAPEPEHATPPEGATLQTTD